MAAKVCVPCDFGIKNLHMILFMATLTLNLKMTARK